MSLPTDIKAVQAESQGKAIIKTVSLPKLRPDYLLIRTTAIAVNPADWKHLEYGAGLAGTTVGCDYAGVVEEVGSDLSKPFKKGDRVSGFAHGSNKVQPEDGAFAENCVAKAGVAFKIPDNISDTEAVTLGLGIATVVQGLYRTLKLPLPTDPITEPATILIYGGSTATGMLGVQYAKLSGFSVVTTCSPANFDYVKLLGADAVFDYTDPERCVSNIRDFTQGSLKLAWDCVATPETASICAGALSTDEESHYSSLLRVNADDITTINSKVNMAVSVAYVSLGERFEEFGTVFEAQQEEYEFASMFFELSKRLLEEGKLKPARQVTNKGGMGLVGALKGLEESKLGSVRAAKLVYTL
ncbi:chaperonin 10-like protein [Thelonectria olida]|uniref:Chaperonin 10-like protein n=1 Tax=Thelonectria olida TaxID=1576542 RepID=A0A9P9ADL1_9HYPO|nr:chaperonin 10-like protein [Thelonectria olida]